ncbi:hypothetical protein QR680_018866 [Steinernema hermaphroditum]|uniref:Uncharacterized protein n=1 Tax=Steinernema hermaphroditum TaxID=289476 RepID=A0AA39HJ84_9BILA|nr:hypothetical protein QR680_018866 [Steinernema hermaphroditum]
MKRPRRGGSPSCRPSSSLSDDVFGPPPRGADREEVPRFVSPGGYAVAASNEPAAKKHRPVRVKILINFTLTWDDLDIEGNLLELNITRQLGQFEFFEQTVNELGLKRLDWCRFADAVVKQGQIVAHWKVEEQVEFKMRMKNAKCEKQRILLKASKTTSKPEDFSLSSWLAMAFGCFSGVLLLMVVVLSIVVCSRERPINYAPMRSSNSERSLTASVEDEEN